MLQLQKVGFRYPSGFAIRDIMLEVPNGCFFGLLGPNGSGKSTLVRLLTQLIEPLEGTLLLDGLPLESFSPRELARKVAVIPSENQFEFPFRAAEIVEMGRFSHRGRLQRLSQRDREIVRQALELTETSELADRPISQLSSGERQLVLLARALAQEPSILVLDEPNAHLDVRHQLAVFRLLKRLSRENGMTLVVVLHDLTSAAVFCDRVAVMSRGSIVRQGPPREVITSDMIREVYGADVRIQRTGEGIPLISYAAG